MQVTKISSNINFKRNEFFVTDKAEKARINALDDPNLSIDYLDNLGLINRETLAKTRACHTIEKYMDCEKSLAKINDIIANPQFSIRTEDTGFFYQAESPYEWDKSREVYQRGEEYETLVFDQKFEFNKHLKNVLKNGTQDSLDKLRVMQDSWEVFSKENAIEELAIMTLGKELCDCKRNIKQSFGELQEQNYEKFIEQSITKPLENTIKALEKKLAK